jgi:hypothetical protein
MPTPQIKTGCDTLHPHAVDDTAAQGWCSVCRTQPTETRLVYPKVVVGTWNTRRISAITASRPPNAPGPQLRLGCESKGHSVDDTDPQGRCTTCRTQSSDDELVFPELSFRNGR